MDHNSLIDKETFEIYFHSEDYPKAFICDKPLAKTLSILNKKGYKTEASCSGHYRLEYYEYFDEDLKYINEVKKDKYSIIKKVKESGFDYIKEVDQTEIYILFNKRHDFEILPTGFTIIQNDEIEEMIPNGTSIHHSVSYYDNNLKRKRNDVQEEIDKYCKILENWASNLPERKEK